MNQLVIPIEINIKENSLIGISAIPVKKLFFLTCHINFRSHIVIVGFSMITKNNQAVTNHRLIVQLNDRFDQRRTKYITMKKSLRTFILLVISNLYGDVANVIHANSAHISIQNHNISKQVATMKHRPIENNNKNS
jgi:hypothetical protein